MNSAKLINVLLGEPLTKEFTYGNHKMVLRTLKQSETNEIMSRIGRNDLSILELQKVPILARSIVSLDGLDISAYPEVRDAIKKDSKVDIAFVIEDLLGQFDNGLINAIYGYYLDLIEENNKQRESLKNFSRVQSEEPSTESVKD